jgi:hypothetical protein
MELPMRISRALTLTAATAATALTLSAVPAQAASLSPAIVADAYSVMLTPAQAKLVGIGKQRVSNFGVANSTKGSPDAPRLCDLSGDVEVTGKGAEVLFQSEVLSLGGGDTVLTIAQETHWYPNQKRAKQAYNDLVQKMKKCEGRTTPVADDSEGGSVTLTTTLTNGEKKAPDGDSFLWVNSATVLGSPTTNFADHDYVTMRLFANFIQIIELDSEGNNAPALTKKQIAAADRLTDSLGDAWQAKFM